MSEDSVQNERSAGVDRDVTHAGRTVTVALVPRRIDVSRASIGRLVTLDRPTPLAPVVHVLQMSYIVLLYSVSRDL